MRLLCPGQVGVQNTEEFVLVAVYQDYAPDKYTYWKQWNKDEDWEHKWESGKQLQRG